MKNFFFIFYLMVSATSLKFVVYFDGVKLKIDLFFKKHKNYLKLKICFEIIGAKIANF